jgi:hypothetical protein
MRLALVLAGLLSLSAPIIALAAAPSPSAKRVEIPITQTRFSGGVIRYSIKIGIDGAAPIDVMLDTGSVGLHLLPGAQPHAPPRGRASRATYGSGVVLTGEVASTDLSLDGRVALRAEVDWTRQIGCVEDRPHCAAESVPLDQYSIGGGSRGGFKAILGVGLRRGAAENPLTRTATGAWIIVLPALDDPALGKLILNASQADRARFALLVKLQPQTGREASDGIFWWDNTVPTCLSRPDDSHPICGPTMLDTGNPSVRVVADGGSNFTPWPAGTRATLAYGALDKPALKQTFTVDHDPGTRVEFGKRLASSPWSGLNAGFLPFLGMAVLYDAKDGYIGLASRADFAAP